jgi:hypothetical protein
MAGEPVVWVCMTEEIVSGCLFTEIVYKVRGIRIMEGRTFLTDLAVRITEDSEITFTGFAQGVLQNILFRLPNITHIAWQHRRQYPGGQKRPLPGGRGLFCSYLQFDNIDCLGAFWAFFNIKADLVTFGKTFKAVTLDGRMVDKSFTAVFVGNKAKSLAVVEPFHSSLCHFCYLLLYKLKSQKATRKRGHKVKSLCGLIKRKNF